jgi:hypothetical protein
MAYTYKNLQHPNKLLVGLHTDIRAAFIGSKLNPMISVPLDYIAKIEEELLTILATAFADTAMSLAMKQSKSSRIGQQTRCDQLKPNFR